MGEGYATIPLRKCDGCEAVTVCRDTDDGRLCSLCLVSMEMCDAVGKDPVPEFKQIIVDASQGKAPTFEIMYEMLGNVVGTVLLTLIERPEHLRVLVAEATEREREELYVGEHVAVLDQDFTSGFWTAACSCGWESTETALADEADAIDAWDYHCDVVFTGAAELVRKGSPRSKPVRPRRKDSL